MRQSRPHDFFVRFVNDGAFFVRSGYYRLRYRRARRRDVMSVLSSPRQAQAPRQAPIREQVSINEQVPIPSPMMPEISQPNGQPIITLKQLLANTPRLRLRPMMVNAQTFLGHVWQGDSILRGAGWLAIVIAPLLLAMVMPMALEGAVSVWRNAEKHLRIMTSGDGIAPFFAPSVQYWRDDILQWAQEHDLDPNLLATVMQIESCGHPTVKSSAGAQGLFQVMPFHFEAGENHFDPATNAYRGASFLSYCQRSAGGDAGLAMACYNGGPSVLGREFGRWAQETQRYYLWGVGIYRESQDMPHESIAFNSWWNAGGARLCRMAEGELGF